MSDKNQEPKRFKRPADKILMNPKVKARKIEPSPKKITHSSQQTNHTSFLGICLKCFTFIQNTTGEVAAFSYEHMCENVSEKNLEDAIKILEEKKSVLVKDLKAMQTSDQKDTIPNEEKQKENELNDSGQNTPAESITK